MVLELLLGKKGIGSQIIVWVVRVVILFFFKGVFADIIEDALSHYRGISTRSIASGYAKSNNIILLCLCERGVLNSRLEACCIYSNTHRVYMVDETPTIGRIVREMWANAII